MATPLGNLGDFSTRARETLAACSLIAAEDTRHTGVLLKHFAISTPLASLHEHNESARTPELVERLRGGAHIALVSDAGTPAISDPGFELVRAAAAAGIDVVAIPGPCAAIAALSIGALATDRFCFEGFLPARSAARRARLEGLVDETRTLVFYEAPHRVREVLDDCAAVLGEARQATLVRELSKIHESVYRGGLGELFTRAQADDDMCRGEVVLLIAGAVPVAAEDREYQELDRVLGILLGELPLKQAAHLAAQICAVRDNESYKRALKLKAD